MNLEIRHLERRFGDFSLGPLSLTVEPGITAVLGPSGSGKSTLLSLIAGFESPDSGHIAIDGGRIDDRPPEDRAVGMVFQNYALFPHLTVRENLNFGASSGKRVRETAGLLEIGGLLDREPDTLSGGEAQRVALARALVSDPEVLLLDEPLSSLDAPIRRRLRLELRDVLADLGIPVVYVTHDQAEAAVVGDRLAVLEGGELVREGPTKEVFDDPRSAFVAEFLGMENLFPATVERTNGSGTIVDIGAAKLRATRKPPDSPLAVAIHPEAVEIVGPEGETDGDNSIACSIERVLPQHTDATIVLDGTDGCRLTAAVDRSVAARFTAGDTVKATVAPEDVHLAHRDQ